MSFSWPYALVVPLLVAANVLHERRRTNFAARFANPALPAGGALSLLWFRRLL